MSGVIVGSYATSPNLYALEHPPEAYNEQRERAFYMGLSGLGELVQGLEVQFHPNATMHNFDETTFLREFADPKWSAVLTCIGGTMGNLGEHPTFGLASADPAGRQLAVDYAAEALKAVGRWNTRSKGCTPVLAVEIHSAPREGLSVAAFVESLKQLMAWDWQGARLLVEHCDAHNGSGATKSKGFLTMEEEIEAVRLANEQGDTAKNGPVSIAVNWARSVLETHQVATAAQHVKMAGEAGLLSGVLFSGVTPSQGPYGPWKDCHMPMTDPADPVLKEGLMSAAAVEATLAAVPSREALLFVGCKITSLHSGLWVGSGDDDTDLRVALNTKLAQHIQSCS